MMKCKKCGNELKESAKFCGKCGEAVTEEKNTETKSVKKKSNRLSIVVAIICVIVVGCVYYLNNRTENVELLTKYTIYNEDGYLSGWRENKYDEEGNLKLTKNYSKDGSLSGYAEFNEYGRTKLILYNDDGEIGLQINTLYGSKDKKIREEEEMNWGDHISTYVRTYEYPEPMMCIEEEYKVDGEDNELYKKNVCYYNEKGDLIKEEQWNSVFMESLTEYEYEYDQYGNILEQSYQTDPGLSMGTEYQYSTSGRKTYKYDAHGNKVEEISYDGDGNQKSKYTYENAYETFKIKKKLW